MAGVKHNEGPFAPRTPPKPGFSIRAFLARQKKEECMICLEKSSPCDFKTLGCNHRFHYHCLATMLNNGHRTCPLCRANINDSWLEAEDMAELFISDDVDEVFSDVLSDDSNIVPLYDPEYIYYRYGSEYFGSDLNDTDYEDSDYYQGEFPHRRIDVFELDDLGLVRLFQDEDNSVNNDTSETDDSVASDGDEDLQIALGVQYVLYAEFDSDDGEW